MNTLSQDALAVCTEFIVTPSDLSMHLIMHIRWID